jgi:hypothetical protein
MLCQTPCPLSAQHRRRSRMQHRGQGSRWAGAPPQLGRAVTSVAKGGEWGPPLRLPRWAERPAAARASRAPAGAVVGQGAEWQGGGLCPRDGARAERSGRSRAVQVGIAPRRRPQGLCKGRSRARELPDACAVRRGPCRNAGPRRWRPGSRTRYRGFPHHTSQVLPGAARKKGPAAGPRRARSTLAGRPGQPAVRWYRGRAME